MSTTFNTITDGDWRATFAEQHAHPRGQSMRTLISILMLGAAKLTASEDIALLKAIAEVESANDPKAVGAAGERGLYQFKESTWRMHSDLPFDRAFNPASAQLVALKHLRYLRAHFLSNCKRNALPIEIAYCWNCGQNYFLPSVRALESNENLVRRLEYGERVENLFREYNKSK